MGFSILQPKKAFCSNGKWPRRTYKLLWKESLLSSSGNGVNDVNERSPTPSIHPSQAWATPPPHPPNVRGPPEREGRRGKEKAGTRREDTSTGAGPMTTAADIQEQASEIELSMLSRASVFWKETVG